MSRNDAHLIHRLPVSNPLTDNELNDLCSANSANETAVAYVALLKIAYWWQSGWAPTFPDIQ